MSQLADKVKTDFPIFYNSDLVYLDSAATSQKPKIVLDAVNSYILDQTLMFIGHYTLWVQNPPKNMKDLARR